MSTIRTDRVRITALFKRKEGISKEDFENYWFKEFPKAFGSLEIAKGKVLKYEQGQANDVVHEQISAVGINVAPYDAQTIVEGASFEDLRAIFTSEEYRTVIGAEAVKYFERGGLMFASNFATIVDL